MKSRLFPGSFLASVMGLGAVCAILAVAQTGDGENIILGRPTDTSVAVHALADRGTTVFAEYGVLPGQYSGRTSEIESSPDGTAVVPIEGLQADTRYSYRVSYRDPGASELRVGEVHSFHTQRPRGATFSFGVQGDSHPERLGRMYSPDLYALTMEKVAEDRPDLYFMLGDDFSISNRLPNYFQGDRSTLTQDFVDDIYINQRRFLGIMASSTALFPVNGNHEEARRSPCSVRPCTMLPFLPVGHGAATSRCRRRTISTQATRSPCEGIGLLGDYFAFEWGDALFISLDPYWHSTRVTERIGGMGSGMGSRHGRRSALGRDRRRLERGDPAHRETCGMQPSAMRNTNG